jgi:multiple antibiotic resistance protein
MPLDPISAFITLLFVMDPLGNIPIFLSVLKRYEPRQRQRIILRELLFALLVLLFFLFLGSQFLALLKLKQESIRVAGGIMLFVIAIRMVFPRARNESEPDIEPFFVPLAVPGVAGPSCLALIMLMVHDAPERLWLWSAVVAGAWFITALVLLSSTLLYRLLGERGTLAVERLMGMLLIMIAVQMFLDGMVGFMRASG